MRILGYHLFQLVISHNAMEMKHNLHVLAKVSKCPLKTRNPIAQRNYILEFFQGLPKQPPVFPVFSTPGYSNANFRILSYVIQVITSSSFATAVERDVLDPLSLSNTYTIKPEDKLGIIPDGNSSWGQNVGQDLSYVLTDLPLPYLRPSRLRTNIYP